MEVNNILDQLCEDEKKEVNNITNEEELIKLLLKRTCPQNIENLLVLLKHSVLPSISDETDTKLDELFEEIESKPKLLFEKNIQDKIEKFISKRYEKDKSVVIKRTSDISKFVVLMGQYLNEAISSNGDGSKNVLNIKEKIQSIDISNQGVEELTKVQTELINAASSIEIEMNQVTDKLHNGKSKVEELEIKIKNLEEELKQTKSESRTDHLTGLLTRRAYSEEVKKIESAFTRSGIEYALVFFDLDHFKNLNDTYGHKCGDVVLSTFAKILKKYTRDHDVVCRYGGEEFVSLVHFNSTKELLQYLKRIKLIVTQNSFIYEQDKIKVTFSGGVAIRGSYETYEDALQKADMLLYKAKESGRNKLVLENGMEI